MHRGYMHAHAHMHAHTNFAIQVHYPSDCVVGALVGILYCGLGTLLYEFNVLGCSSCLPPKNLCYASESRGIQGINYHTATTSYALSMSHAMHTRAIQSIDHTEDACTTMLCHASCLLSSSSLCSRRCQHVQYLHLCSYPALLHAWHM